MYELFTIHDASIKTVKGEKVLNGVIIGEAKAEKALENLTNEELKNLDIKIYFEKYYRENGGI